MSDEKKMKNAAPTPYDPDEDADLDTRWVVMSAPIVESEGTPEMVQAYRTEDDAEAAMAILVEANECPWLRYYIGIERTYEGFVHVYGQDAINGDF